MDYECLIFSSAHLIKVAGVAVLLFCALLSAGVFARCLPHKTTFQAACLALRADLRHRPLPPSFPQPESGAHTLPGSAPVRRIPPYSVDPIRLLNRERR